MIYRTYGCDDCGSLFEVCHDSSDEPYPDCPNCSKVLEWRPKSFAIGGSLESKAVNIAQDIMEKDYGLTNFKDNTRAGDISAMMPVAEQTAERDKVTREIMEYTAQTQPTTNNSQFWGNNAGAPAAMNSMTGASMLAMAKVGPQGADPMAMLHSGVKKGRLPDPLRDAPIVAGVKM